MASSTDAAISPAVGPSHEPFSINILVRVKTMQQQNGLRRQDYHRYRQYCTRRLHRIRKATKLTNGRERFKKCAIPDDFTIDKVLEIPLVSAERAWAYSSELLGVYAQFIEDKPALKYHGIGRLRKAVSYAQILLAMCKVHCDSRTVMEAEAYESFMAGVLEFNLENYTAALEKLTTAKDVYQKLSVLTTSKTEGELKTEKAYYAQMLDSDIAPKLRQCRYYADEDGHPVEKKAVGAAVKEGAKASKSQLALLQQIDATKAKGDARGDVMSLEDYYNASDDSIASAIDGCSEVAGLCQEVLSKIHSEMVKSEEESGGVDWAAHEVEMRKVSEDVSGERSLLLIYGLLAKIRSLNVWIGTSKGRMSVKPEEGVRLCDMLLDTQEGRAEKQAIKDLRLFFLALSHASAGKVPEAISLLQLLEQRTASQLRADDSRLSRAAVSLRSDLLPAAATQWRLKGLLQLVAEKGGQPVEAPAAAADSTKLFPPPLQPMPSKPLVIDMAFDYITPPDLSKEIEEHKPQKEAASTGLLGRLGGWWGGGKN